MSHIELAITGIFSPMKHTDNTFTNDTETRPQTPKHTSKLQLHRKFSKATRIFVAVVGLLLLLAGGMIASNLSQITQDLRQSASTPDGFARIWLTPSSSLPASSPQEITVSTNMGLADKKVVGVQFFIDITGDVPFDVQYVPQDTLGMNVLTNTVTDTTIGKRISFAMTTTPPQLYTTTTANIVLGKIQFTTPSSGQMTLTFDPQLSKIVEYQTVADLLQNPESETYAFVAPATSTPIPSLNPTAVPTGIPSATPRPTSTLAPTSTPFPTPTPGSGGPSITPPPSADLSLTKSASTRIANVGDTVRYTIAVKNSGPGIANNVTVSEQFNSSYGIKLVATNYSQGSLNLSTGTWNIGTLAVNQTATLMIDIQGTTATTLNNTAQIATSSASDFDSVPGNNNPNEDDQQSVSVAFAQSPALTATPIPTSVPLPTNTPWPTTTPRPTATQVPALTSVPISTATPRPSVYPSLIPFPTTTPGGGINGNTISIDITQPTNGQTIRARSTLNIETSVSSTNEVQSVRFYANNAPICYDRNAPYSCKYRLWFWRFFRRWRNTIDIKAVVIDVQGNTAQHTIQVSVQ